VAYRLAGRVSGEPHIEDILDVTVVTTLALSASGLAGCGVAWTVRRPTGTARRRKAVVGCVRALAYIARAVHDTRPIEGAPL